MKLSRRTMMKIGIAAAAGTAPGSSRTAARESTAPERGRSSRDYVGVLVDTTLCIGCRKCEEACNRRNHLPRTARSFSDRDVLRAFRRPTETAFTVVNQFPGSPSPDQAGLSHTYCKVQCMHCLRPSCVSACIVGALTKAPGGAVVYEPRICIGCRYCQVACPFEIPAYEFHEPLTPRVRKCELCSNPASGSEANPACAGSCPTEALVFGRRADLIAMARDRLQKRPDRYVSRIYGEHEMGGTSWLYLTGRPVREIGLLDLPDTPPPELTEAIQHGIFRYGAIPVALYGLLAGIMWHIHRRHPDEDPSRGEGPHDSDVDAGHRGGGAA